MSILNYIAFITIKNDFHPSVHTILHISNKNYKGAVFA